MNLPEFTRSTLPSPGSYQDRQIIIIEPSGSRWVAFSDGANWIGLTGEQVQGLQGLVSDAGNIARLVDSAGTYALQNPAGGVLAVSEVTPYVTRTTTGTAFSGACELAGYDCTVAAGTITIYDGTSTAGTVIVPATTLALGRTEFAYKRALITGCHVVLSGAATVNVLVG